MLSYGMIRLTWVEIARDMYERGREGERERTERKRERETGEKEAEKQCPINTGHLHIHSCNVNKSQLIGLDETEDTSLLCGSHCCETEAESQFLGKQ